MEKIIRVTGEGKVAVAPDTIRVSLQVSALDKKYSTSLAEANKKVEKIKQAVLSVGIDEKNIITSNFSVYPRTKSERKLSGNYEEVFLGYETQHNISVSFNYDTQLLGKVIDAISSSVAEPRLSIGFIVKNQEGIKEKLIESAVKNAKADAEVLASAAGVKLGDVLCINHSFSEVHIRPPRQFEMRAKACMDSVCENSVSSSLSSINVENIDFEATVTIDYEIKTK